MEIKIEIRQAVPLNPDLRFRKPVDWTVRRGESWAVAGPNGAGKTVLADMLMKRIPLKEGRTVVRTFDGRPVYEAVKSVAFRDIYSVVDCREAYYQQRWNADGREATPLARSLFPEEASPEIADAFAGFSLRDALGKRIVSLSSGELRKMLILRALCSGPEILIIDNPFVGLDEGSREELSGMLGRLSREGRVQFILLISDPAEIPGWVDMVLPVRDMELLDPVSSAVFAGDKSLHRVLFPAPNRLPPVPHPRHDDGDDYRTVALLDGVTVRYGDRTILDRVNWHVARGDKWALTGPNGSGKSTLLSLLYGDNPQAYANRISLFDRRRGTGESIWEIKRRIGYLNADLHSYYLKDIPAEDVVMSGFHDTVGLYSAGSPARRDAARVWLDVFGGAHLAGRKFIRLSFGEQRLVMLARTFVKCPPVVILDEPMHGLDAGIRERTSRIIDEYCSSPGVTLIYVTHYSGEIPACADKVKRLVR